MTGLGTTGFKDTITGLTKVFDLYMTTFEENRLETWTATEFSGSPAIDMATRYFTPVQDAPDKASVPFNHDVDPAGLLTRLMGNTFIHASDNEVIFFKRRGISDGKWTYMLLLNIGLPLLTKIPCNQDLTPPARLHSQ